MGNHVWAGQQAGWQGQRDRTHHPTSIHSSIAPDRTGSTVPPPQHGKAAPRVGLRGCRAFIQHTTSRHDTGVQDGVGREPVIGAEGALHATLAWAGERKQERTGQGQEWLCPKHLGFHPRLGTGMWERQGHSLCRGWSRIRHLHTLSKFSPQIFCRPHSAPLGNAQHRYLQSKTELTNITNN